MFKRYQLKIYPDRLLRQKALPVETLNSDLHDLIGNMAILMYENYGIGLAAPQVGVLQRIIIADIGEGLLTLINPEIIEKEGQNRFEEGCLSLPGIQAEITRNYTILVRGIDPEGQEKELDLRGLMSRVIQHEIDHLNGVLIIDHVSLVRKFLLTRQLEEARQKDLNRLIKIRMNYL
ncbi:MAG: peptide deformylase [Desulfobacterales bacterium]